MRMLESGEARVEIAMTPLIDMMFLLIIFFLVSTAFISPERDQLVDLAEASQGAVLRGKARDIIVNVRQGGILVVGGSTVTIDELEKQLIEAARHDPKPTVKVRGDARAYHKQVVNVLDACNKAKIDKIAIVTRLKQ